MQNKPAAVRFILVTVLLDMIGIGLIIPVMPKLVTTLYSGDLSTGAHAFGWFVAVYALMQFLCAPTLGNLSDAYGRRPVLLVSLLGAGLDYLMMAFAPTWRWLFVGRVISGITGANIAVANAYIADVTPPEERAKNFGLLGMCFGVGFIVGPALGGVLGEYGLRAPFLAAAVLNLCNTLYGFFVLPESHARANRRSFDWSRINPLVSLQALARFPVVLGLTATILLERIAHDSLPSTWVLFTTYRFHWTEWQNGLSLTVVGISFAIVSGGLTGRVVGKLGERRALIMGLCVSALGFLSYGLATRGWMLYVIIAVTSIGGVAGAALMALITKLVPANEQGALQGALASVQSIAAIIGPLMATNLFGYFTSPQAPVHLPGAAFLASSFLVFIAMLLAVRSARMQPTLQSAAEGNAAAL